MGRRSASYDASSSGAEAPDATASSFQAMLNASSIPVFAP
jgi:hypothetical protein